MSNTPILYTHPFSVPGRAVWLTARAIGLELENRVVDLRKGEHLTIDFLKMNPQHTIPTLDDNGYYLWDSHAICTYLVEKYGKNDSLYPKDLQARAKVDQRLFFEASVLFPPLKQCLRSVSSQGAIEYSPVSLEAIEEGYNLLNEILESSTHLVGNSLTLADFACITTVTQLEVILPVDEKFKNIHAWIKRMEQLPYYEELNSSALVGVKTYFGEKLIQNRIQNQQ